jgi:fructose-1,6-bisphosphatase II
MAKTEGICACNRFAPVTEAAALAAAEWIGRGDGLAADQASRDAMSAALGGLSFDTRVVAGRMAYGLPEDEETGGAEGREADTTAAQACADTSGGWDLAVAPLEGHEALARGREGALAMLAAGPRGSIMAVPEMYMQKLVVSGPAAAAVDMNGPVNDTVRGLASALGKDPRELTVAVLDRPRHEDLIAQLKGSGARLKLIDDGDVSASLAAAIPETGIDMCIGIGGSTEGIITAAALRCLGGAMQARFWPVSRYQVEKVRALGIEDVEAMLMTKDMAGEGALVAVTAVTTGRFLRGVEMRSDGVRTETLIMCSHCNRISLVKTIHRQDDEQPTPSLWTL